ncbi:MAG: OmpA family protein [bacterium]
MRYFNIITVLLLCGCVSIGRFQKKDMELAELNEELRLMKQDSELSEESLRATLKDLRAARSKLEDEKEELQSKVNTLNKDINVLNIARSEEVNKVKGTYDDLVGKLNEEIKQGQVEINQLQDKISVNLLDKILFDSGQAEVNESGKKTLSKVGGVLKKIQDKRISVEGHTDNVKISSKLKENIPTNWELSALRAINVVHYLQDAVGISPNLLSAVAYGEYKPVADNKTASNRSKNRRIEIILVPIDK